MNSYVTALILLLLAQAGSAQQEYLYISNLEAYEGTWEYRSGNETFQLLIKVGSLNTKNYRGSCLIGDYYHVKNGQVLNTYLNKLPSTINDNNFYAPYCPPLFGHNGCVRPDCVTPNQVDIFFWDRSYGNMRLEGFITILNSSTISFEVWEMEDISGTPRGPVSVPRDVVMTKIADLPQP